MTPNPTASKTWLTQTRQTLTQEWKKSRLKRKPGHQLQFKKFATDNTALPIKD
jgi:hypothetical protein